MTVESIALFDWWWWLLPLVGFIWGPRTWVPGELVTAASMNTNIRDHLNESLRTQTFSLTTVAVTSSSVANPSVITTGAAHGLVDGNKVVIAGHSGSTPDINGEHVATVISSTTFSIPVNVTVGGTGGTVAAVELDDFDLDGPFAYVKCNNTSELVLTGALIDSGNVDGARVIVEALDKNVILKHQHAGSATSSRFINDHGVDISLAPLARASLIYDSANTRWRVSKMSTDALALHGQNFLGNPDFLIWSGGDSAFPDYWDQVPGGDATVARDTVEAVMGKFAMKLTFGTVASLIKQALFATVDFPGTAWEGRVVSIGCGVKTGNANQLRVGIYDGIGTTWSSYHTGGGSAEWLTATRSIAVGADRLQLRIGIDAAGFGFIDFPTFVLGPVPPQSPIPCPTSRKTFSHVIEKTSPLVEVVAYFAEPRPFFVDHVQLNAAVATVTSKLVVDIEHWDGTTWQTMYGATKVEMAAAAARGGKAPDGTYRYRCFGKGLGATPQADGEIRINVTAIPSGGGGKNTNVQIHTIMYQRPHESLLAFDHVE